MKDLQTVESTSTIRPYLHIDGIAILAASLVAYGLHGGSWWLFAALLLAPDVAMVGYVAGPRTGALIYNTAHSLAWPALLISLALLIGDGRAFAGGHAALLARLGMIWAAHIGMDRALGYGYKYPTHFKDTHMGRA